MDHKEKTEEALRPRVARSRLKKRHRERWERGSGIMVLGVWLILAVLILFIMFAAKFKINQNYIDVQNAVDTIADGTAFYMASQAVDDAPAYLQARRKADDLNRQVKEQLGINLDKMTLDPNGVTKDMTAVVTGAWKKDYLFMPSLAGTTQTYTARRKAATTWQVTTAYLDWMTKASADNAHVGYSQFERMYKYNPTPGRWDVDCSSFVSYALLETGYFKPDPNLPYSTHGDLQQALSANGFMLLPRGTATNLSLLRPGDIVIHEGHVTTYYGNGLEIAAHGAVGGGKDDGMGGDQIAGTSSTSPYGGEVGITTYHPEKHGGDWDVYRYRG